MPRKTPTTTTRTTPAEPAKGTHESETAMSRFLDLLWVIVGLIVWVAIYSAAHDHITKP